MSADPIKKDVEAKMKATVDNTAQELGTLRTGRASLSLLDPVQVECYGDNKMPLRQLANCTLPDARTIVIQPFDKSVIGDIEKAIQKSDLGLTPNSDGNVIRLGIPALSEDRRKDLVKVAKRIAEEGRVSIRNIRRDGNDKAKKAEKSGDLPEDVSRRLQDDIQETTDSHIKQIDELLSNKEEEILSF